jgi:hypothetical protein
MFPAIKEAQTNETTVHLSFEEFERGILQRLCCIPAEADIRQLFRACDTHCA